CYSELQLVDERIVGRKPESLSFGEAATLPLTTITAWEALFDRMHIRQSETATGRSILIVGGAGGVGSIATQLARTVAGLTVIATASRPESREWCLAHGADLVIDHTVDIPAQIRSKGFKFVDYIFCLNSIDEHFPALAEIVAPFGWVCSIVGSSSTPDIKLLFDKSAGFTWELMFTRPKYGTEDMIEQHLLLDRVSKLVDAGAIRATLNHRLSPIDAANLKIAHRMIESGHTIGKIVIERSTRETRNGNE
ncbi:MAG TPA: zinc-binding alcohol dehydrogenase family protein, partial [Spirochaetia bacterium]|nr:zinc-binding alcohol dehydrogenase family protein [Spirochaetia bacterium]